jgi:hypothetical protein
MFSTFFEQGHHTFTPSLLFASRKSWKALELTSPMAAELAEMRSLTSR